MYKILIPLLFLSSCTLINWNHGVTFDYMIYKHKKHYDLKGRRIKVEIVDSRNNITSIPCGTYDLDRDTELENEFGLYYFKNCVDSGLVWSNAILDSNSTDTLKIYLEGLSRRVVGFGFMKGYGLVKFTAILKNFNKSYCEEMRDGDKYAPIDWDTVITPGNAARVLVSGAVAKAVEEMIYDLE